MGGEHTVSVHEVHHNFLVKIFIVCIRNEKSCFICTVHGAGKVFSEIFSWFCYIFHGFLKYDFDNILDFC